MSNSSASMRIAGLLDAGSFVEIGGNVTARSTSFNMQAKETPSDGVITGYGTIDCKPVYVYSQDASVLGGTIGEMHARKIVKLYDLAMKTGVPVAGLIDCAGMRLQEATDALNAFGELYLCQIKASGMIPQITGIFGTCGGGMAVIPTLTDFTFMDAKKASLYVNSPNTLECQNADEIATAEFQAEKVGVVDIADTEEEVLSQMRTLISFLPANSEDCALEESTDDLNRLCEGIENCAGDTSIALSMIADNHVFTEVRAGYAKDMVTGFMRLNGATVGAVANRTEICDEEGNVTESFDGRLSSNGCGKAAKFIKFCDAFNIPILTITNVSGLKADRHQEMKLSKAMAEMAYAYGSASVPMVNVMAGKAYGSAYVVMNSKALGADLVFAWPESSIGMMNAESAVRIMYAEEIKASKAAPELIREKAAEYQEAQASAQAAASRGYVDAIIDPAATRKHVIAAFEMLYTKRAVSPEKKHGTV
ncbi:MAG: carboxyl transferase domain-containing protein [Lachnospiraceae bacterium]|nr:carboxyl transferase domain-containing protein [Lachnospiraceae bacterium]